MNLTTIEMYAACLAGALLTMLPLSDMVSFVLSLMGYKTYEITDSSVCNTVQSKVLYSSRIGDNKKHIGICICKDGSIINMSTTKSSDTNKEIEYKMMIIATQKTFDALCKAPPIKEDTILKQIPKSKLTIYEKSGSPWAPRCRIIDIPMLVPTVNQQNVIESIKEDFAKKINLSVLLYGEPGTGKSATAFMLAHELKCSFSNSFELWTPYTTLSTLYHEANPTRENPLILVFEEIDIPLLHIHNGTVKENPNVLSQITDKPSWNKCMDDLQMGMYPYLILIMTTNKDPRFFDSLDPSYMRKGRVNMKIEIK